jgi:2-keto-4-pentenoate hydratase
VNAEQSRQEPFFEAPELSTEVAACFVDARLAARALPDYPGPLPESLDAAYARQDAAIARWPDRVAGWKVGRIPDAWLERMGEDRLMGPVFARQCRELDAGEIAELYVIEGGFSAVEAEYIFVLGEDADPRRSDYRPEQAASLVAELRIGIELAGSPLPTINELGPAVVVSDFGNNAGVFLGPTIDDWRSRDWASLTCATEVEGVLAGRGGALHLPGGPLAALAFALNRGARRGRPLRAGMVVSTGAATGIHDILAGQSARLIFDGLGELRARALPALPGALGKAP